MYLKMEPGSKEEHMRKINQLILKIFEYVARPVPFDKNDFEQFVEKDEVWSAKCYTPRKGFYKKIENLCCLSQEERVSIYNAIQHDMEFDRYFEDPNFVFREDALDDQQRDIVKELISYLYESPFNKQKFLIQNQKIGYHEFKESLFERNLSSICPVCLTMQTDLNEYGEVDHYFPKEKYPALIFHPMNLVVICGECNGFMVKGRRNALRMGNLTELYLPYLRNAENEAALEVRKVNEEGKYVKKMVMVPRMPDSNGLVETRIQNFDDLYDLSKRWTCRMYTIIDNELKIAENEKRKNKVLKQLHNNAKVTKRQAEKNKTKLLEATTLSYLENEGKAVFLAEWQMQKKEREKMKNFWERWK